MEQLGNQSEVQLWYLSIDNVPDCDDIRDAAH